MPFRFDFLLNLSELFIYFLLDNTTKFVLAKTKIEHRLKILLLECFLLGLFSGIFLFHSHFPPILLVLLFVHLFGTFYSTKHRNSTEKTSIEPIPPKYLYSFPLKRSDDQSLKKIPSIRSGIFNRTGSICSLNALLQSFASFDRLIHSLQRNSKRKNSAIFEKFLRLIVELRRADRLVDPAEFLTEFHRFYPNLLNKDNPTDLCELFQSIVDLLTEEDSIVGYASNVVEQVQNKKLTTISVEELNRVFLDVEKKIETEIFLENLDQQISTIVQYIDVTWLLHQNQKSSTMKEFFSGQILHGHCCSNCSNVRFRAEPFQILPLAVPNYRTTLEELLMQMTKIEVIHSIVCPRCSTVRSIDATLSPIVQHRRPFSDRILSSTPIAVPPSRRMKSQMMIGNLPEILSIQLKRFTYDRLTQRTTKLNTEIFIEPEKRLDLTSIHYRTWFGIDSNSFSSRYRLIAACLHVSSNGNFSSGHSLCLYRSEDRRWFLSDDERMNEISHVEHFFQTPFVTENKKNSSFFMTSVCIICFNNHAEDDCPDFVLSSKMNGTEKKPSSALTGTLSKVLLSLPTQIQIRRSDDTITFSPTVRILKTTIIGPFEGRFVPEENFQSTPRNQFLVKIFRDNGHHLVLDATDERLNNWCCLIPPARTSQEINCLLFQRKQKLYAKVVRTILASESLSIWYASNYAKAMGMPETPDGSPLALYGKIGRVIFR